ncbi:tRNA preQ1(34) S-adenosylmethionine ribosyltransferase-isomerase QueA [Candidatus Falkowbacteria bacterium HGW-Falkowbacteria-2]|uniref:S-adenosylmethionine:tRNA ribosyltransferase-isomerase n=1 Tax=Candidatus Falkowbacteria bacterium HGW-Falkowbacteria-2 TaxID=2013769 RepID=A0A2N2DYY4_9BACT|nr:MAG: tRNA preQ1(34) S-adenosylmethionine ribosyltransferase-isomerase QueA [Candidatus Falkowbacteria bacterium HGW-Falkowbacteria-2]
MSLIDYDYILPRELIAQEPAKPRDHARLLCVNRQSGETRHLRFDALSDELRKGDVLVVNDSKVFPARLIGTKESGGRVEIFLHHHLSEGRWECLVGGRIRPGLKIKLSNKFEASLICDQGDGTWLVDFNANGAEFYKIIERIGHMPLPPYITPGKSKSADRANYQTVYADDAHRGSVAAPTAGLHFTERLLKKIRERGVKVVHVTLHVGLGTFAGVKSEDIRKHEMHSELAMISKSSAREIMKAKSEGRRVIAVGTTACRVLESYGQAVAKNELAMGEAYEAWTSIFIYPGYKFQVIDGLITNFHLPKSSLIMLVSAFAGYEKTMATYQLAIAEKYRFYSYGDAVIFI